MSDELLREAKRALLIAHGALIEVSPCADERCKQVEIESVETALKVIAELRPRIDAHLAAHGTYGDTGGTYANLAKPEAPRQYSPEEFHEVAINTFVPKDFYKNQALGDLVRALERPDGWKPEVIMAGGIVVPPIGGNTEATASTTIGQPEAAEPIPRGISRNEWHDKAWALYHAKTFDDAMLSKLSIHTIRAVFNATYDALYATPVAARPAEHFDACPDGKTCVSTTTGCRPGQCFYRRAKFYPDGSFSIPVAAQRAEAESIPAMTIRFAAEAWAAYGLDTALVGDDQFHRAWQATCAAANAGYFAALRPAPASGLAEELEQLLTDPKREKWLPVIGKCYSYTFTPEQRESILTILRGQP